MIFHVLSTWRFKRCQAMTLVVKKYPKSTIIFHFLCRHSSVGREATTGVATVKLLVVDEVHFCVIITDNTKMGRR